MPLNFKLDDPLALDVVDGIVEGLPLGSTAPWMPGGRNSTVRAAEPTAPASPTPNSQPATLPVRLPANLSMARIAQDPTGQYPALAPVAFGRVGSMDQAQQQPQTRMGTLKHVLGKIGTIAAGIADPNLIPQIPGTRAFREREAGLQQEQGLKQSELEKNRAQAYKDIAEGKKALGKEDTYQDATNAYYDALARNDPEAVARLKPAAEEEERIKQLGMKPAASARPLTTAEIGQQNAGLSELLGPNVPKELLLGPGATDDDAKMAASLLENIQRKRDREAQQAQAEANRKESMANTEEQRKFNRGMAEAHLDLAKQARADVEAKANKPTADEQRRGDLAENLNENFDQLEEIIKKRPDLFGPVAGRLAGARAFVGTSDPDIAALDTLKHQIGMAQISAHGMRSAQGIIGAADSVVNNFHNSPEALMGAINAARNSVKTFQQDVEKAKGGARAGAGFKVPAGAPAAPAEDGHTLKMNGEAIAVSKGGKWVAAPNSR